MNAQAEALQRQIDQLMKKAQFASVIALCELRVTDEEADVRIAALLGLNIVAFSRGEFASAKQHLEDAIALARERGSQAALCDVLCRQSSISALIGLPIDTKTRRDLAQEALKLAEAAEYKRGIVYSKLALGSAYIQLGAKSAAEREYEEAVKLARDVTSEVEVQALNSLALFCHSKKQSVNAIDYGKRALKIAQANRDDLDTSILLSNLSDYYLRIASDFRSYDSSLEYSKQGLALANRLGYVIGQYSGLLALASSYQAARLPQKSVEVYLEALDLVRSIGEKTWEYNCVASLANLNNGMKNNDAAFEYSQQALALATEMNQPRWRISPLNIIGNVYHRKKQPKLALENWRKALALHDEIGLRHGLIYFYSRCNIGLYSVYVKFRRK